MAQIEVAIGTSHAPQLNTPPQQWHERAIADRRNDSLWFRGHSYSYPELVAVRANGFADQLDPGLQAERHAACRSALDRLGKIVHAHDVDVLVIVSSDHKELFDDELLPAFAVYWGDQVDHVPFTQEQLDAFPPGLAVAEVHNVPAVARSRPCHRDLALHLLHDVNAAGFDVSASGRLPAGRHDNHGIPHGWGFVYQQILGESCSVPFVPVFVNTFYPPNQPSAARCYEFGQAIGRAVAAYPEDLRVGLVASGGLSHFVVDEELDRPFLAALCDRDADHLRALDADLLRAGSSELRSWTVVAGAVADTALRAEVVDYQPAYRSEAGTGVGMAFASWQRES